MPLHKIVCRAALMLALIPALAGLGAAPASADPCEGDGCARAHPTKPLDIMKFMRAQAASTRPATAHPAPKRSVAAQRTVKHRPPKPQAVTATTAPMPAEAATSFAAQPAAAAPQVEVVAEDELNAIDRAGEAAPPETTGAPPTSDPQVQIVEADTVNGIDREAAQNTPPPIPAVAPEAVPQASEHVSWLRWLWSGVRGTVVALAAAVHQLIG